jgi:hypothetical protein
MRMNAGDWQRVHGELTRLARSRSTLDAEEAGWLVEAVRVRVHEPLGFGSLLEYLERVLGHEPRTAKERLRVADALTRLPAMRACLAKGELPWSAVRELSRVAIAETEADWVAAALGKTVRQVEEMVSGRRSGDRPTDAADPGLRRHILRLEISADALAAFRDARRHLEIELGHSLEDDEMVRTLAHRALDGGRQPGRAAYQVALTICPECRRGARDGAGRTLAVETHRVEAALCDAQHLFVDGAPHEAPDPHQSQAIGEPADQARTDELQVGQPLPTHAGQPTPTALAATKTIPSRIRRLVWRRAHGQCQVPGCRAAKSLEIHHLLPRSEGGDHDPARLLLLCDGHHLRAHAGHLRIDGVPPDRLVFTHANGVRYGDFGRALDAGLHDRGDQAGMEADAVGALRRTGVALGDARRAVAEAARSHPAAIEDLVRRAFVILARTVYASRVSEPQARYSA